MPPESSAASPAAPPRQRLRRLSGRSPAFRLSRAAARARLWVDDGQLIQESLRSYTQEIQRFAFADIQSVQLRRTMRGMVYNIVLVALLALPLIGLVSTWNERGSSFGDRVALAVTVGVFALLLLINTLRGPTCRAVLTTALGPQHLPSLSRMPPARRALETIRTGVDAVQGVLRPDEAAQLVDQAQAQQGAPGNHS